MISVVFTTSNSLISRLIRWYLGTPYSHVALIVESESIGRSLVYEANWSGVVFKNMPTWAKKNEVIYCHDIDISKRRLSELFTFCIDNLGKKYGYVTLLSILFKGKGDGDRTFICSELLYRALEDEMKHVHKRSDLVTPKDIYEAIK